MTMNTLMAAKFIIQILQRWTQQMKHFVEWKEQLIKCLILDRQTSVKGTDENPAKKIKLEEDMQAEADFTNATQELMNQISDLQNMLERQLDQISIERESFAEYISYSFRNVPQDKRLACFTECMEIILKYRGKED